MPADIFGVDASDKEWALIFLDEVVNFLPENHSTCDVLCFTAQVTTHPDAGYGDPNPPTHPFTPNQVNLVLVTRHVQPSF